MNTNIKRVHYIDALRGAAIMLSLNQHIGAWLYRADRTAGQLERALFYWINSAGGLAAPLFITLAGVSAMLFAGSRQARDSAAVKRGAVVILYGYLLNVLAPGWFSWGAWFVLHMIGFGIMTTPVVRRLPNLLLAVLIIAILGISVFAQQALHTPIVTSDDHMNSTSPPGGLIRLILFEGHFPVFPWSAFFLGGAILGRLLSEERIKALLIIAAGMLAMAGLFTLLSGYSFARSEPLTRLFTVHLLYYPMHPFVFMLCYPAVIFAFLLFRLFDSWRPFSPDSFLNSLGKATLSIYVCHIVLFKGLQMQGLLPGYGTAGVLLIVALVIGAVTIAAHFWAKTGFRYGLEWLLRKLVPSKKITAG